MQFNKVYLAVVCIPVFLLGGCGQQDGEDSGPEQSVATSEPVVLEGSSWQLASITALGGYEFIPEDGSDYVIRFRAESRMVAQSDCNTAGATWTQNGNSLTLEQFVTTNNMCPPGTLHNHFVSNLRNVGDFTSAGDMLTFSTSIPGVSMTFVRR